VKRRGDRSEPRSSKAGDARDETDEHVSAAVRRAKEPVHLRVEHRVTAHWPVRLLLISSLVVGALTACGGVAARIDLVPGAADVRTGKADPPERFIEIGPIEAVHGSGCGRFGKLGTYEGAYNMLRNKAAQIGATYVRIDTITEPHSEPGCYDDTFVIRGTAYRPGR
jgi:hypothetical protein